MKQEYNVAAYYFPNYHVDKRNEEWHGKDWTEWELVKRAEPRFEWHKQPKIPLWGYEDEADPKVMEKKINAAANNGLSAFIFDWYWYEDGQYLYRCIEEGFLKAKNSDRLKFSIMWANHDWIDIHPATRERSYALKKSGLVSEEAFTEATDHIIKNYFSHPSYWRVDGGLYFSIYELMSLIDGLGGIDNTRKVLLNFRERVKAAGLGELHLNAVIWGVQILPGEEKITDPNELVRILGFNSVTSYVWIHHYETNEFPKVSYAKCRDKVMEYMEGYIGQYSIPYYPNVTMGWDASPRTIQSDGYDNLGYPYMYILDGNMPNEFEIALWRAKELMDKSCKGQKVLTINAWNEWTEGSYLEPDVINGMKYLEAIKKVFG